MFLASFLGIFEHVRGKLRHVHDKFGYVHGKFGHGHGKSGPVLEMMFLASFLGKLVRGKFRHARGKSGPVLETFWAKPCKHTGEGVISG